jgi:hypothetical protein
MKVKQEKSPIKNTEIEMKKRLKSDAICLCLVEGEASEQESESEGSQLKRGCDMKLYSFCRRRKKSRKSSVDKQGE